jgi:hypothetical protein
MPDFSKEQSKKVQVGSKEGIITILKHSSLKTYCSETQLDPILAQIGKKDGQTKRGNRLHSLISNNCYKVENLSKELQRVQVVTKRVLEKSSEETREPFGTKVRLSGGLKLRNFLIIGMWALHFVTWLYKYSTILQFTA